VLREALLVSIAAAASFAFLFHGTFYLDGRPVSPNFRIEPFLFVTGLAYLFLRFVVLAIELRPARVRPDLERCPECGRPLDDQSSKKLAAQRKGDLPSESTRKEEALSPGLLRQAVDAVRPRTQVHAPRGVARPPTHGLGTENLTGTDLVQALNDPNFLERARHGPKAPEPPPER
jgi:hypothetical protein